MTASECLAIGRGGIAAVTRTTGMAGQAIRRGMDELQEAAQVERLLITADAGGSNGSRRRLWKVELQKLANETGLQIAVCHFPPGTSKWNKIEHRMFSHITENWRGRPLVSHEVIVNLIANTRTEKALAVRSGIDSGRYPAGVKVSDEELAAVRLTRSRFHGDWNYSVAPEPTSRNVIR